MDTTTRITNIILNVDRFQVFALINGIEEKNTFMPDVTAADILAWVEERVAYYASLNLRRQQLLEELNVIDTQA